MHRILLITSVLMIMIALLTVTLCCDARAAAPPLTSWQQLTADCPDQRSCWLEITPSLLAVLSVEQVTQKLEQAPSPPTIDYGLTGSSVQWVHPEGYQGYMIFNDTGISFLQIIIPSDVAPAHRIRLADVILRFGPPSTYSFIRGNPFVALRYENKLMIVRVNIEGQAVFSPYQRVTDIMLMSPIGDIHRYEENIRQWNGFGTIGRSQLN